MVFAPRLTSMLPILLVDNLEPGLCGSVLHGSE